MNEFEEISFFELVRIIIREWKLMILTILLAFSISLVLSIGFNTQHFTTKSTNTLLFNNEYLTEFGQYNSPYTRIEEYANMFWSNELLDYVSKSTQIELSEIKSSITITVLNPQNIEIKVKNLDQSKSDLIHNSIQQFAPNYLNYILQNNIFHYFTQSYSKELVKLNDQLKIEKFIEEYILGEINQTPISINGNSANPLYFVLLDKLIQARIDISESNYLINQAESSNSKINLLIQSNNSFENFLELNQDNPNKNIIVQYGEPTQLITTRFDTNVLYPISTVLGIILGIFVIFIKSYWMFYSDNYLKATKKNL